MDPIDEHNRLTTRRMFLGHCATGLGTAALAGLFGQERAFAFEGDEMREVGLPELPQAAERVRLKE